MAPLEPIKSLDVETRPLAGRARGPAAIAIVRVLQQVQNLPEVHFMPLFQPC
jgi:hypothetical protein